MKVRAIRTISGEYGLARRGQVVEIADAKAKQLIARGLVAPVEVASRKEDAKKAPERPSKARQSGGETGEAKQSSSSPAAPPRKKSASKKSEAEPASSSSTTRGNSHRGQTSYTRATASGGSGTKGSPSSKG